MAAIPLAGRQHRRHDDSAGVHRAAPRRCRRNPRHAPRCRSPAQPPAAPSVRMCPIAVQRPSSSQACSVAPAVVLVAGGKAEADHIDQRLLATRPHGGGQFARIKRGDRSSQLLGNGNVGKFGVHRYGTLTRGRSHRLVPPPALARQLTRWRTNRIDGFGAHAIELRLQGGAIGMVLEAIVLSAGRRSPAQSSRAHSGARDSPCLGIVMEQEQTISLRIADMTLRHR